MNGDKGGVAEAVSGNARFQIRMSPEFRGWTDELADHLRMEKSALIERALVSLAKAVAFDKPAPKREGSKFK
jgi:hypothetical protein